MARFSGVLCVLWGRGKHPAAPALGSAHPGHSKGRVLMEREGWDRGRTCSKPSTETAAILMGYSASHPTILMGYLASHPIILITHCFPPHGLGQTLSIAAKTWQKLRGFLGGCLQVQENLRGKEAALIAPGGPESSRGHPGIPASSLQQLPSARAACPLWETQGQHGQNMPEINISQRKFCNISYACHIQMFFAETDGPGFY